MTLPKREGWSEGQIKMSSDLCVRECFCRNPQPQLKFWSVSRSLGTVWEFTKDAETQSLPLNCWTWISIFTRSQLIVRHQSLWGSFFIKVAILPVKEKKMKSVERRLWINYWSNSGEEDPMPDEPLWSERIYAPWCSLFTVTRTWEQTKRPSADKWMKKMGCIHTVEYSALKRMKLCHLQIATRVSPGTVTVLLSEVSQTRRRNIAWTSYMWNRKKWHKWIDKTEAHRLGEWAHARFGGRGELRASGELGWTCTHRYI